jgi:hypothetical protein
MNITETVSNEITEALETSEALEDKIMQVIVLVIDNDVAEERVCADFLKEIRMAHRLMLDARHSIDRCHKLMLRQIHMQV